MGDPSRVALSRDRIAATALAMTDEVGLDGLSMRKLGSALGVEAMSLYHYVKNKADLCDAMIDLVFHEVTLPDDIPDDDWETAFRQGLTTFNDVLVRHPAALNLVIDRSARSGRALKTLMWAYGRLAAVGLDPEDAHKAFQFAASFVIGHRVLTLGSSAGTSAQIDSGPDDVSLEQVAEFIAQRDAVSTQEEFKSGLDAVIAGLRAAYNLP